MCFHRQKFKYKQWQCLFYTWGIKSAFHLSELSDQTIPVAMRISLLFKIIQPDQSMYEGFHQELLEKAYFIIVKMTGLAVNPLPYSVCNVLI